MSKTLPVCFFVCKWILLLLTVTTVAYTPTYSNYNCMFLNNSGSISMNRDGTAYSAIDGNALVYYRMDKSGPTLVSRIYHRCTTTGLAACTLYKQAMNLDGSRIISYSSNEMTYLRFYKIVNDVIVPSQSIITALTSALFYQLKQDLLFISTTTAFEIYRYNSIIGQYQPITVLPNANYLTPVTKYGLSTDGKYIIGITNSLLAYIYTFDGTNYNQPSSGYQIPIPASNGTANSAFDLKIQKMNSTTYALIIVFRTTVSGGISITQFYTFSGGVATFIQELEYTQYVYTTYLSQNTKYLLQPMNPPLLKLYQFDPINNVYVLTYNLSNFYSNAPSNNYIAENGSFIYGNLGSESAFYFACTLAYCVTCSTPSLCIKCASTFTLTSNSTCVCNSNQTLIGSICVNCNIAECSSCSATDVCAGCGNGFTLANNTCVCGSGRTISLIDGSCVSCIVSSCDRCDESDLCALYAVPQAASAITQQVVAVKGTVDQIQNGVVEVQKGVQNGVTSNSSLSNTQIAAITLLALVLIAIIAGLVYLAVKVKAIANGLAKVNPLEVREETLNPLGLPVDKSKSIMVCEGEEVAATQLNYEGMQSNSGVDQRVSRGRRRKNRSYEISEQQNVSMEIIMDKELS